MKAHIRDLLKSVYLAFLGLLPDEWAVQVGYLRKFRRLANLREPVKFSEKVNWRKLHQRDPRFSLYDDKVSVKDEIARLVGREYVIPTLWVGSRPEDIPFAELTPPYIIKVNHGFGSAIFVRDRADIDERKTFAAINRRLRSSRGRKDNGWGFYDKPTKVLVERMLLTPAGGIPDDYKFFVYHGRVHFIQLDSNRWSGHQRAFYDREWNKLPIGTKRPNMEKELPAPSNLQEMLRVAEKIGSQFDFVRVDLYSASDKVHFGETTFYPGAGYSPMSPDIWDDRFGEPWHLPGTDTARAP